MTIRTIKDGDTFSASFDFNEKTGHAAAPRKAFRISSIVIRAIVSGCCQTRCSFRRALGRQRMRRGTMGTFARQASSNAPRWKRRCGRRPSALWR